jgi:hypothetical protein
MSGQNRPLQFPPAQGGYAPPEAVESLYDVRISVVSGRPSAKKFIQVIRDKMKIRTYQHLLVSQSDEKRALHLTANHPAKNATRRSNRWHQRESNAT